MFSTLRLIAGLAGVALITTACAPPPPPKSPQNVKAAKEGAAKPALAPLRTVAELGKGRRVLLVTHPTPTVLQSIHAVVDAGLLGRDKALLVVGVFHQRERRSYASSRALVAKYADPRFALLALDCPIAASDVYKKNACTPHFERLLGASAGVVFTGGADIPPALYGEKTLLTTVLRTPLRQYWEISFLAHLLGTARNATLKPLLARRPSYAVLGICMGMQAMNVATGGTLVQDIPSEIYGKRTLEGVAALPPDALHRSPRFALAQGGGPGVYHRLRTVGAEKLWKGLLPKGGVPAVMSVHHQAVEKLGKGLKIIATSTDGKVPEALRHERFGHVLAVQFHPEYYYRDRAIRAGKFASRKLAGDPPKDSVSVDFHERFWRLLGKRLIGAKGAPGDRAAAR